MDPDVSSSRPSRPLAAFEVFAVFLKLGLTSFGGPVAHIGYFRREFVVRRGWLNEAAYSDLVGLCQLLPGPASSQVGFSVGLLRAGWLGGLAAWCGFTIPSMLLLLAFATLAPRLYGPAGAGLVHGLKLVAVAVVAQAVWDMAHRLCPDRRRAAIALFALAAVAILSNAYTQIIVIALGAVLGFALCRSNSTDPRAEQRFQAGEFRVSRTAGAVALSLFLVLLLGLPELARLDASRALTVFDAFYRAGALVFGGGHVVLPLLEQQTVATGWVTSSDFLTGYGAAQAVPGPLFTFATWLGWMTSVAPTPFSGALLATAGIFLPGMLLVLAALPYWQTLRALPAMAAALSGVNAAVVGLLAAALYSPVWTSAIHSTTDFAIASIGFLLLTRWKAPPLAVVALCALTGIAAAVCGW